MKRIATAGKLAALMCIAFALSACGGGGGGGKKSEPTPAAPAPPPSASVAISSPPIAQELGQGDNFATTLTGTWSGSNLAGAAVYLQITDNGNTFTIPAVQLAPAGNAFSYTLNMVSGLTTGDRTGTLSVRACKDLACTQPFANAAASVNYQLKITPVGEWETFQGNAAHNGYVPVRLDPARFGSAWEWTVPMTAPDAYSSSVGPTVTSGGAVHVVGSARNTSDAIYDVRLYALDEASGIPKWNYPVNASSRPTPSASGGIAYLTSSFSNALLTGINATTGARLFDFPSFPQAERALLPATIHNGVAYFSGGSMGEKLHAMDASGKLLWMRSNSGAVSGLTPAVDQNYVYAHRLKSINLLDRWTGDVMGSIDDPNADGECGSSVDVPMLGARNNVIVFSCKLYPDPTPGAPPKLGFKLSSFNIPARALEWVSEAMYLAASPAVANGVIYARRADTGAPTIDALDETTGRVLWTWTTPAADDQAFVFGNLVVTRNLLFVGTAAANSGPRHTWAIDLNTRQVVWRYPAAGSLTLSANRTLYLTASIPNTLRGKLLAFKLQ